MRQRIVLSLILAAVLVATAIVAGRAAAPAGEGRAQVPRGATIAYAVDGDTLRVSIGSSLEYVRLVGIDTPEDVRPGTDPECGSLEAAASMRRLAPEGARVQLRFDSVADRRDKYGRLLAHAFVAGRQLEIAQLRRAGRRSTGLTISNSMDWPGSSGPKRRRAPAFLASGAPAAATSTPPPSSTSLRPAPAPYRRGDIRTGGPRPSEGSWSCR